MNNSSNFVDQIKDFLGVFSSKTKEVFSPVTAIYMNTTAPIRSAWADYAKNNPRESKIVGWIIKIFGSILLIAFLTVLFTALGLFGHIPSTDEIKQLESANATEIYTGDGVL
ncbi:MAG: hypothetical protein R2774_03480, partial [Saprospiraceae bacterium]